MCELKKYKNTSNTRIDKCMGNFIENIKLVLPPNLEIVACCCGHFKYPMTIILRYKGFETKFFDMVSSITIPRKRNFYKRDKQGYYYIPEVIKNG